MIIILTGASGFIGSSLFKKLSGEHQVIKVSRHFDIQSLFLEYKIDVIIHCATSFSSDKSEILEANISYGIRLLNLSIQYDVKFINLDSTSYYYRKNLYSQSKKIFRDILIDLEFKNSLNIVLELVYGIGENPKRFISSQITSLLKNRPIDMTIGTQTRNIIHIEDVSLFIKSILSNLDSILEKKSEIFLVSENTLTIQELMLILKNLTKSNSIINFGAIEAKDKELSNSVTIDKNSLYDMEYISKIDLRSALQESIDEIKRSMSSD